MTYEPAGNFTCHDRYGRFGALKRFMARAGLALKHGRWRRPLFPTYLSWHCFVTAATRMVRP